MALLLMFIDGLEQIFDGETAGLNKICKICSAQYFGGGILYTGSSSTESLRTQYKQSSLHTSCGTIKNQVKTSMLSLMNVAVRISLVNELFMQTLRTKR